MLVYSRILLCVLFSCTRSANTKETGNDNPRTVNLALETILEFHRQDRKGDIQFLNNIEKFINKVRRVIGNSKDTRRDFPSTRVHTLTQFVQELVATLNNYKPTEFQDFFDIFYEEIRKYHYRGCRFHELLENSEIRQFLGKNLDKLRDLPVPVLKTSLNLLGLVLKNELYDKHIRELVDFINSLYKYKSKNSFVKVLNDLDIYKKSKSRKSTDLVDIVRDGIRSIIFDHYTQLNQNARRELKYKIEKMWEQHKRTPISFLTVDNLTELDNKPDIKRINKVESDKKEHNSIRTLKPSKLQSKTTENIRQDIGEGKIERIAIKETDFKNVKTLRNAPKEFKKVGNYSSKPRKVNINHNKIGYRNDKFDLKISLPVPVPKTIEHTTPKKLEEKTKPDKTAVKSEYSYESHSIQMADEDGSQQKHASLHPETGTFKAPQKERRIEKEEKTLLTQSASNDKSIVNRAHVHHKTPLNHMTLLKEATYRRRSPTEKRKRHPQKSRYSKYDSDYHDYVNTKHAPKHAPSGEIKHSAKKHKKKHLKNKPKKANRAFLYEQESNTKHHYIHGHKDGIVLRAGMERTWASMPKRKSKAFIPLQTYEYGAWKQLSRTPLKNHKNSNENKSKQPYQNPKKHLFSRKHNNADTPDQTVLKKIKELQEELKEVKTIISDGKSVKSHKENNNVGNRFVNLRKDNTLHKSSPENSNRTADNIVSTHTEPKNKSENKEHEINYNVNKQSELYTGTHTKDVTKLPESNVSNVTKSLYTTINNVNYNDTTPSRKIETLNTLQNKSENPILINYDDIDEWKDVLELQTKDTKKSTDLVKSTTAETTATKPTEPTTNWTESTKLEIYTSDTTKYTVAVMNNNETNSPVTVLNENKVDNLFLGDTNSLLHTFSTKRFELKEAKVTTNESEIYDITKVMLSNYSTLALEKDLRPMNSTVPVVMSTPVLLKNNRRELDYNSLPMLESYKTFPDAFDDFDRFDLMNLI